jgi:cytochrome P450
MVMAGVCQRRTLVTMSRSAHVARPPGPGPVATLRALMGQGVPATDVFATIARRYPRIAHLRLAGEHVYFLHHPDAVRELFVTHGRFTVKGRALQRSKPLLGEGLLTSEGELWRRQRSLVQPAFHADRMGAYVDQMVASATEHTRTRWSDGTQLDLASDMAALTLAIVGRALFGSDLRADTAEVGDALAEMVGQFQRRVVPGTQLLDRLPLPSNRRGAQAIARLDAVVGRLVAGRQQSGGDGGDVLSALLATEMADRQVRDEVMTLVLAGHETTANAMTWAWYLLSRHQRAAARMRAELDSVLGGMPDGRPVGLADLAELSYTTAVVAETIRLYPPAWAMGRRLVQDVVVDGWTLPAGSLAIASQWVLHRDPSWWTDAGSFVPERWLDAAGRFDQSAPGQPRGSWFPFGLGQRVCVGEPFAWAEAVVLLATLARSWQVDVDPAYAAMVAPAVTLRPRGAVPATVRLAALAQVSGFQ